MSKVNTGNPLINEFFRELDARLADPSLPVDQKQWLKKLRPAFLAAALDQPDHFERELANAASAILNGWRG